MQDYEQQLRDCLGKLLADDDAGDEQKAHAKALRDSYGWSADGGDPPEGSGN